MWWARDPLYLWLFFTQLKWWPEAGPKGQKTLDNDIEARRQLRKEYSFVRPQKVQADRLS
jgi:hypothetical protein